jgi:hypothetical protein
MVTGQLGIAFIICDVRRRMRHLFITSAVVLYISSSRCWYRLYEFSYYAPNKH